MNKTLIEEGLIKILLSEPTIEDIRQLLNADVLGKDEEKLCNELFNNYSLIGNYQIKRILQEYGYESTYIDSINVFDKNEVSLEVGNLIINRRKIQNEKLEMQRSDEFDATQLGPQWQWNYEPRKEMFSLSERPGWLRLRAFKPLHPGVFLKAGNTLTQRSFRTPHNEVTVKLDISHMADGLHAGLAHFASQSASLGIVNHQGQNYLEFTQNDASTGSAQDARQLGIAISSSTLWLKSVWGLDGKSTFYYSLDGIDFIEFGQYQLSWGFYRGDRIGIYCYNDVSENGFIDVDYLRADISTAQTLTVDAEQVLCRVEPLIYGAGAEDVNHEIYGGLYDQKIFGEGFEEPAFAEIKGFKAYDEQWCIVSGMTQLQTSRHGKLIYEGR